MTPPGPTLRIRKVTTLMRPQSIFCPRVLLSVVAVCLPLATCALAQQSVPAVKVELAKNGEALLPIVVPADASPGVRAAAQTLADYLKRITGGEWAMEEKTAPLTPQTRGVAIGLAAQFPALADHFKTGDPTRREDYLLRSHADGLLLVGATELAVQHAVWDLLHRLGYRQFFPGETWEVVPQEQNLSIAVDDFEHPDYYARRISFSYRSLPENREPYAQWQARNRMASGIWISTSHAYERIIARNKAEFDEHPEYLTRPGGKKFRVSEPGLRQLVVRDALAQFDANPDQQSISMDPSDGGGWDVPGIANRDAEVFKTITDRVVTLANDVAEAVNEKYPGKYVGMYAYNYHAPPPTIKVHPNVVVSIATKFIKGGLTVDQLFEQWGKQGATLGVREYYGLPSNHDLPGGGRAGNLKYLQTSIPRFHAYGARFMLAEACDNWGVNGLGHYFASRLLWDVEEASRLEEIKADFLDKAFGPAREPMAEFYRLIDGSQKPILSDDLVGRMYRQLDLALNKTDAPRIRARLLDLALYTRYVELFRAYRRADEQERLQAYGDVLRYTWRIRRTQMVHTLGLWRTLMPKGGVKGMTLPPDVGYRVPEGKNPWKSSEPFSEAQVLEFIAQGIANNKLLDFVPVTFSDELVPAAPLKLSPVPAGHFKEVRHRGAFHTWVETAPSTLRVQISHGLIHRRKGNTRITLSARDDPSGEAIARREVPPDGELHDVSLETTFTGLHTIEVDDRGSGYRILWPEGVPTVMECSTEAMVRMSGGRWSMYFYVPKGTKVVGGMGGTAPGQILDGSGETALRFPSGGSGNYWSVPVPAGQDGKLWKLDNISGGIVLMTVPPYLARSAEEMMVPAEVLQADMDETSARDQMNHGDTEHTEKG